MKRAWIAGPLLLVAASTTAVAAQDMTAVAHVRHEHFKELGGAFKGIADQLKSGAPSVVKVQTYAKRMNELAPELVSWFPAGSGPEAGIKTHAKAVVWQKPDEFKKDAQALVVAVARLNTAAASGDMTAVQSAAGPVGEACKTCHQTFREKED